MKGKKAQVTIFIIVAILLVGATVTYFLLRKGYQEQVPAEFKPAYDKYMACLEEHTKQGLSLMGEQAGWIYPPDFVPGSQYMPFSSQLDFLGQPVPYWLYVSGNNILKEQVPTKSIMQEQLAKYISERIDYCDFAEFPNFDIQIGEDDEIGVEIGDSEVKVSLDNEFIISSEGQSVSVAEKELSVKSKMGKFHKIALDIYNYEKKQMFLEKYAIDVMRLYAPVTGVELTCAPKVFNEQKIREDIVNGLVENTGMIKVKGGYYDLVDEKNKYFVADVGSEIDENVNFVYLPDMPTRIEIYGDMVSEPVGLQEGLGILGFCYVPYHLVYDINYPVLVQIFENGQVFQFPIAVIIDKNRERNALEGEAGYSIESEVCKYKDYEIEAFTYDSQLSPVPASIKFKCLNTECSLGESKMQGNDAVFRGLAPACVNGFLIAKAEGYADAKYQISSNEESVANIVLNKKYNVTLDLGKVDSALVNFKSEAYSASVIYPEMPSVELIEGQYNISVYAFRNSSLKLSAVSQKKCVDVPQSGIGGIFGFKEEKCFDINIPEQEVSFVLTGGGSAQEYLTEGQLERAKKLNINIPLFKVPTTIQEVQDNYLALEDSVVLVEVIE